MGDFDRELETDSVLRPQASYDPGEAWATHGNRSTKPEYEREIADRSSCRTVYISSRFRLPETYPRNAIRSATAQLLSCLTNLSNKIAHAMLGTKEVDFGQRSKAGGAVVFEKWRMELVFRRQRLEPDSSPLL